MVCLDLQHLRSAEVHPPNGPQVGHCRERIGPEKVNTLIDRPGYLGRENVRMFKTDPDILLFMMRCLVRIDARRDRPRRPSVIIVIGVGHGWLLQKAKKE